MQAVATKLYPEIHDVIELDVQPETPTLQGVHEDVDK
jgi:hypothetical protein